MVHSYKYSVIRIEPRDARGERLNVGVAIIRDDGLDVRVAKKLDKLRSISCAFDEAEVRSLVQGISELDRVMSAQGLTADLRMRHLSCVAPLSFSSLGCFVISRVTDYEERVEKIMRTMVDPEPPLATQRAKRTRLLTQIKRILRHERVLAQKDEDISSHRIVTGLSLDEGLVADLALKNSFFHVVETVDASHEESLKKAVSEIAVAALVLERARMKFDQQTRTQLVYNASSAIEKAISPSLDTARSQGAVIFNWASDLDRRTVIDNLTRFAIPLEKARKDRVKH